MIQWRVLYLPKAKEELERLDKSQRILVLKMIQKVSQNPLSSYDGGYGKPLGNKNGNNLYGLLKIKLKSSGLRVIYKVEKIKNDMIIIVVAARADNEVYSIAMERLKTINLKN